MEMFFFPIIGDKGMIDTLLVSVCILYQKRIFIFFYIDSRRGGSLVVFQKYPYQRSWRWIFVKLIDLILIPFGPLFRRKPFPDYVRNILVIRLDQIGDLVCALPIFPLLKKKFPYARITVLADNFARDILEGNPYVDRLFTRKIIC